MNNLDKKYTALLQNILDNGVEKKDRTGTGTLSVFGRQIRHDMSEGFPLLTTKKMHFKSVVTELLWFLRGDTNIKYLVDNDCHIWDGDAYKNFEKRYYNEIFNYETGSHNRLMSKDEFILNIKTDNEFAKEWGELGPIYGKQWRSWRNKISSNGEYMPFGNNIDQIANLINLLKTNPDSRRLMVNAWNVGELDQMVLPPCHYGFQVYTRELSLKERMDLCREKLNDTDDGEILLPSDIEYRMNKFWNIPQRAISLMWNQRSVDTFLGLPFNIASYGLLLTMIADEVNMVPDELIGNLGDVHLYSNHIEQAKEQIGRELTIEERTEYKMKRDNISRTFASYTHQMLDNSNVPKQTREPYPLPTVHVRDGIFCSSVNDVVLENYQSHPTIKAPLSN
jgi:thymidylate synthase